MNIFITGGAGFIGSNSADHFLGQGHQVTIFDNMSRVGTQANLEWLYGRHGSEQLHVVTGDVRDYASLAEAIQGANTVLHLAGQVAVTLSVQNPREDFEINALGTFNVLEAVRNHCPEAAVLYASTNKVYGGLKDVEIVEQESRYAFADYPNGIPETYPLDFHSPYGCSKGAGDQYMVDYARIYGLKTMVMRQSCIYGRRQFGVEDQGWVAYFLIATVLGLPISIYGDGKGKQVRDLLHVSDLIHAYELGINKIDTLRGEVFNLGGGPQNTFSIWAEFGPLIEELTGKSKTVTHSDWRSGDQLVFIADTQKAHELLGWQPKIAPIDGIHDLYRWVIENTNLFTHLM
ncbi:MAG: GDP-mannose 4,6-dehydratase [Anaerolineales bacterium]|nr:GDP-mannose 4,6-dehydratase [Anaerolineales bacterium]